MIVTEQEANTKACPFARTFDASRGSIQLIALTDMANYATEVAIGSCSTCIGSECMSWDWLDAPLEYKLSLQDNNKPTYIFPKGMGKIAEDETPEGWVWIPNDPEDFRSKEGIYLNKGIVWREHPSRRGQCQKLVSVESPS